MLARILKVGVVAGVVANGYDYLVSAVLLSDYYRGLWITRPDPSLVGLAIVNFTAAFVFVWLYDRVRGSFDAGVKGGATYGLYVGIVINFPLWIFTYLLFKAMHYGTAWVLTGVGVLEGVVVGAVVGALYDRMVRAA